MKRIIPCLLALIVLVSMLCVPAAAAREEQAVVVLHDCDKALGGLSSQKNVVNEGNGALAVRFTGTSFVSEHRFLEEDVSETDVLAMDVYIPDLSVLDTISNFFTEVSSSGTCDVAELQWDILPTLKEEAVEEEWFTIYMLTGSASKTKEAFDDTAVNYFRIYAFYTAGNHTIYVDNIRMCYVGGEDFSELNLDAYAGENPTVDIQIKDLATPDLSKRDEGITVTQGLSASSSTSDEQPTDTEQTPEQSEQPENPEESSFNPLFLLPVAAAVVVAVVIVILAVKKKKA